MISEPRLLPGLLLHRNANSAAIALYRIDLRSLSLKIFGPPLDGSSHYLEYRFDTRDSKYVNLRNWGVQSGISSKFQGISIGFPAYEQMLRSPSSEIHLLPREEAKLNAQLTPRIAELKYKVAILACLFKLLSPMILYAGHDCYEKAIDVNLALSKRLSVLLLPKGKVFHAYNWPVGRNGLIARHRSGIYESHLRRNFRHIASSSQKNIPAQLIRASAQQLRRRLKNINTLSYMHVPNDTHQAFSRFAECAGLNLFSLENRPVSESRCYWLFALHSFADEPFVWGADRMLSLFNTFLLAAEHIHRLAPGDTIIVRPHPNHVKNFDQKAALMLASNQYVGHPVLADTILFDLALQLRLCTLIRDLGLDVVISPFCETGKLLSVNNIIVVTKHGNISIEAAWKKRFCVFSSTAPYSSLFSRVHAYRDQRTLHRAVVAARSSVMSGKVLLPTRAELARYQATIDFPYLREVPFSNEVGGGIKRPISDGQISSLSEIRFPTESLHEQVQRLRNVLRHPIEKDLFDLVYGLGAALRVD